jgi:hypothetical protein
VKLGYYYEKVPNFMMPAYSKWLENLKDGPIDPADMPERVPLQPQPASQRSTASARSSVIVAEELSRSRKARNASRREEREEVLDTAIDLSAGERRRIKKGGKGKALHGFQRAQKQKHQENFETLY